MPATNEKAPFRGAAITHYGEAFTGLPDKISYLAFAEETCPTTGRKHYQTWAYATRAMRLTGWKKAFPGDHIEQMRGTFAQNDAYCSKENQLTTFGEKPMGNGQKRCLEELSHALVQAAQEGVPICDIVTEEDNRATFVQYHGGLTKLYQHAVTAKLRKVDKDFAPEVIYVFGTPGSGKSRYVREKDPEVFMIPVCDKYKWKDGYAGQDAVLYENVSPKGIDPDQFLTEIDRYYCQVAIKGGFTGWRPKRIYITSVYPIDVFASTAGFSLPTEFTRRVTRIVRSDAPVGGGE